MPRAKKTAPTAPAKKPAPAKKAAAPAKKAAAAAPAKKKAAPKALTEWVAFVKKVQKEYNLTYKEAMVKASELKKQGKK